MARKKTATVEYLKDKVWSIAIRSSDPQLRANLIDVIEESEKRGLTIINALLPFLAGMDKKPRKTRVKKPELPDVPGPGRETGG